MVRGNVLNLSRGEGDSPLHILITLVRSSGRAATSGWARGGEGALAAVRHRVTNKHLENFLFLPLREQHKFFIFADLRQPQVAQNATCDGTPMCLLI